MQLKRDTDYALRIMLRMAEHFKETGKQTGILSSYIIAKTGIPVVTFNRIVKRMEEHNLLYKITGPGGITWLYSRKDFWDQSLLSIVKTIEDGTDIFGVFDRNYYTEEIYGRIIMEVQSVLDQAMSEMTIKVLLGK